MSRQDTSEMYVALQCELPPRAASVREARDAARAAVRDVCDGAVLHALLLVVSELVTNAVEHARSDCQLRVLLEGAGDATLLRVEVIDGDVGHPVPRPLDPESFSGRGLHLVEQLASRWGVEPTAEGKRVYAEVPC